MWVEYTWTVPAKPIFPGPRLDALKERVAYFRARFSLLGWEDQKRRVLGGEACVWTEYEDRTNLIPRTWPRAALVAEKLWSSASDTASVEGVPSRLDEQRCRLLARGYDVEPLLPSYCSADIV